MNKEKYFALLHSRADRLMSIDTIPKNVLLNDSEPAYFDSGDPLHDAILKIEYDLNRPDNWGDDADGTSLCRPEAEAVLAALETAKLGEIAKKTDLDDLLMQDVSAAAAIKKMETDLAYRMPGSGRPLSHVVLPRGGSRTCSR